ncbi:probable nicotinate-nucleotide adenylyltransferase [Candidatus Vecturithrix granuli]|uniref:Probable nicotinate-nucleotide adenylyltransferase n=1 Tax=Vecturithrix granuli TaxID=1499967 RepID=A0A0S6W777_VECG1|nr:probable nicotinate-nucleotide adenylyltransferase [Candidatus Vecturithrix granuli]
MNIALLGGSFNPPHICHIFIAQYVLATTDVEQVWFLPCYQHAFGKQLAPFEHRLALCQLAVASFSEHRIKVLPLERERQGTSWTIDTVRYVIRMFPDMHFIWIIGSDVLSELDKWKDFDQLLELISFVIVPRAGAEPIDVSPSSNHPMVDSSKARQTLHQLRAQYQELKQQGIFLPDVSSSRIRERIKNGLSIQHLVPRPVKDYIEKYSLYRND